MEEGVTIRGVAFCVGVARPVTSITGGGTGVDVFGLGGNL